MKKLLILLLFLCSINLSGCIINGCDHEFTNYISNEDATCEKDGTKTAACDKGCGAFDTIIEEGSAKGHNFSEWFIEVEPTISENGLRYRYCYVCNLREEESIDKMAHEHEYEVIVVEPTCTNQGFTHYQCSCGESYIDDYVDSLDHDYMVTITEPDCVNSGYKTYKCSVCSFSYKDDYIEALGHQFDEWIIEIEPTDNTNGLQYRLCKGCNLREEKIISSLPHVHQYREEKVDASCSKNGYILYECYCGHSYMETISAFGHQYDMVVTTPTCVDYGFTTYTCRICHYTTKDDFTDATGHNLQQSIISPTCNEQGYTLNVCLNCNVTFESDYVPATEEHEYEWQVTSEEWCFSTKITEGTCIFCQEVVIEYEAINEHIVLGIENLVYAHRVECLCGQMNCTEKHTFNQDYQCLICNYQYDEEKYTKGLSYQLDEDDTYIVTGIGDVKDSDIRIPLFYNYLPVTKINGYAFEKNYNLKTLEISASINSIDQYAFSKCANLEKVIINEQYEKSFYLATSVFENCPKLKEVYYNGSIDNWGTYYVLSSPCANGANLYINGELVVDVDLSHLDNAAVYHNFEGVISLKSIALPKSDWNEPFFKGCVNLESIIYPEKMKSDYIDPSCYEDCKKLKNVYIPYGCTTIHQYAFKGCESLEKIHIPDTVTNIYPFAFTNCKSLQEVIIPSSVTYLSWGAFSGCSSLRKVDFFANVTQIDTQLFEDCIMLEEINFGDNKNMTKISTNAFNNCINLKAIDFPSSVISIDMSAFEGCESLEKIELVNIETVGTNAFFGCTNLQEVVIGKEAKQFESYAFANCINIQKVNYLGTINEWVSIEFEYFFGDVANPLEYGADLYLNNEKIVEVEIDNIEKINDYAFYNCQSIRKVTIGDNVQEIGRLTFYNIKKLYTVTLGKKLESIGEDAFYDCLSLYDIINKSALELQIASSLNGCVAQYAKEISYEVYDERYLYTAEGFLFRCGDENILMNYDGKDANINLPENLTYEIANYAFYKNQTINKVNIPANVTKVGKYAFADSSISEVSLTDGIQILDEYAFYNCDNLKEFIMPDSITTLSAWLLAESDNLEKVYIGSACTTLYTYAFQGCKSLTTFEVSEDNPRIVSKNNCIIDYNQKRVLFGCKSSVIPADVEIIGISSFAYSYDLESIVIPDNIKTIEESAFYGCTSLEEVSLSRNVKEISKTAFAFCESLKTIDLSNVNKIGSSAFYSCKSLDDINLSDNITSIGSEAFLDCRSLSSIYFGKNLTSISYSSFGLCASLKEIIIPANITEISIQAFSTCENLEKVTVMGDLSFVGYAAFGYCPKLNEITFMGEVEGMAHSIFSECFALESIDLSHTSLKEISSWTFEGCSSLKEVLLPDSVIKIKSSAFSGCSSLEEIKLPKELITLEGSVFRECKSLKSIEFNDKLETIGNACFYECGNIKEIKLPNSVKQLGESCFSNCTELQTINIPTSLQIIPNHCFTYTNIKYFEVPTNITKIGYDAFFAANLEEVRVLHNVEMSGQVFAGCFYLKRIILTNEISNIDGQFNGALNLEEIFYMGSQEEWNELVCDINDENEVIASAKVYFYSDSNPNHSNLYWYWDENNIPTIW